MNSILRALITSFLFTIYNSPQALALGECAWLSSIYGSSVDEDTGTTLDGRRMCELTVNNVEDGHTYKSSSAGVTQFQQIRSSATGDWNNSQNPPVEFNTVGTQTQSCFGNSLVKIWRLILQFNGIPELLNINVTAIKLRLSTTVSGRVSDPRFGIKLVKHRYSSGELPLGAMNNHPLHVMFSQDTGQNGFNFTPSGLLASKPMRSWVEQNGADQYGYLEIPMNRRVTRFYLGSSGLKNIGIVSDFDYHNVNPTGLNYLNGASDQSGITMRVSNRESMFDPRLIISITENP